MSKEAEEVENKAAEIAAK